MKVSEIKVDDLKNYLRTDDSTQLEIFLSAAKSFVRGYTGLDDSGVDSHDDLVPVIFVLVSDMYENREYMVQKDKVNRMVQYTLDMYSTNLL